MRTSQSKRMRGRSRGKSQNPLSRVYESNGPDVKIRGSASHIAEKYIQLARDAQSSGDPIAAEGYYQHAEHYFRLIATAQEQYRQNQPYYAQQGDARPADESFEDGDDDGMPTMGGEPNYGPREPRANQPYQHQRDNYQPRENQHYQPREQQPYQQRESQAYSPREPQPYLPREPQPQHSRSQQHSAAPAQQPDAPGDVERLPSFITGGAGQGAPQQQQGNGQNGHEGGHGSGRYPMHRRRRSSSRGPRNEASSQQGGDDAARTPSE